MVSEQTMPNDNVLADDEELRDLIAEYGTAVLCEGKTYLPRQLRRINDRVRALLSTYPTEQVGAGQPSAPDTWLQSGSLLYRLTDERIPQNRDEINVTMADGSRDDAACARRAEQLLAFLAGQPEPHAEASPGVIAAALAVIEADRSQTLTNEHVDALDIAIKIQRGVFKLPEARAEVTDATHERRHWNPVYNTDPVQRACVELPDGYEIEIMLERDAGTVDVCGPDGGRLDVDLDEDTFDWKIHAAIDAAIGAARAGGQHADQA